MASEKKRSRLGFATLEYAVVLPFVLTFIFGAIDVTNYFRAYTALQEGVQTGLRCLYPTDAQCTQSTAPQTMPINDLYLPPFFANQHNYDGIEKHLILPNYSFGPIQAKTLKQVSFTARGGQYETRRELFIGVGSVKYLIAQNPAVRGFYEHASIYGGVPLAAGGTPQGHVLCSTTADSSIGSLVFDIPRNPAAVDSDFIRINDCIQKSPNGSLSACDALSAKNTTRIFLNLHGDGFIVRNGQVGSNQNVSGHLNMRLEYLRNGEWTSDGLGFSEAPTHGYWNLGGQQFSGAADQSFIPRGFTYEEFSQGGGFGTSESNIHFQKYASIKVPYGVRARIRFELHGMHGSSCDNTTNIGWRLSGAQIVMPDYLVESQSLPCQENFRKSECEGVRNCSINPAQSSYSAVLGNAAGPVLSSYCTQAISADDVLVDTECFDAEPDINTLLNRRGVLSGLRSDYSLRQSSGDCIYPGTRICDSNFGVSSPSVTEGANSYVVNSPEAQATCPAPPNAVQSSLRWDEEMRTVHADPIMLNEADCTFREGWPLPASLIPPMVSQYKKLELPLGRQTGSTASYKFPGNPDDQIRTTQFNCPAVSEGSIVYDEEHADQFSGEEHTRLMQSMFIGSQNQLGCSRDEILKQEAVKVGMNPAAYFKVGADAVTANRYLIDVHSIDSCKTVMADASLANTNLRTKVSGGPFDLGVFPGECFVQGHNTCISIPAGVREVDAGGFGIIKNEVFERAQNTIKTFMPNVAPKVELTGNSNSAAFDKYKDPFGLKASVEVPLLILGNHSIHVSYEAERNWEGQYLRGN